MVLHTILYLKDVHRVIGHNIMIMIYQFKLARIVHRIVTPVLNMVFIVILVQMYLILIIFSLNINKINFLYLLKGFLCF